MMRRGLVRLAIAVALAGVGIHCGGSGGSNNSSSSPTAPGPTPSGPACRTYPTMANVHTVTSGTNVTFDALEIATFDASTRKATVQTNFANGAPCSTNVVSYNSVADFVDEVRVIPPVSLAIRADGTNSGQCGSGTGTTVYVYDSQRRVTQITNGTSAVTTYTAWDNSGRPTSGTSGALNLSLVYNDPGRSYVVTTTQANTPVSTSTLSFDANGNQTSIVLVQGNVTTTTTFTTTATAQACK